MRMIDMIVVHCSATRSNRRYTLEQLRHDHVAVNGWRDIGYHFYITLDGVVHPCRPIERMGAHARGYNAIPLASAMREDSTRTVASPILALLSRSRR